ncbi:MAG: thiamine diphosphokinase [Bacilli bacterium]
MNKIAIVAAGPSESIPSLGFLRTVYNVWIAVDRGLEVLRSQSITPHIALGDWDSYGEVPIDASETQLFHFNPMKNDSDLELGMTKALEQNPEEIHLYGITGGRLDHEFASLFLAAQTKKNNPEVAIYIHDKQNTMEICLPGIIKVEKSETLPYISMVALCEEVCGITHDDAFVYRLENGTLKFGSSLCISNELIGQIGYFSFESGILLVVRSSDAGSEQRI